MNNITHSAVPFPTRPTKKKARKRVAPPKWQAIFRSIQATGQERKLDGEFTQSQYVGIYLAAQRWSNRQGGGGGKPPFRFGDITVRSRSRTVDRMAPSHKRYAYSVWVTVADQTEDQIRKFDDELQAEQIVQHFL